ncbi:Eco57I restriction-modification methylase domain-containing protein [Dactylococcopsis salina]|uniref:site-specific DNA-methyltransferase (adenine-specific) n=1 Tax=Dactylococcopsis salina (strain PCC 8305) TaxID=13035 RepID=K9YYE7_DACS8|nr:DNA methyltransferase [Dactylococcopsis salina]AFZ51944.1 type I restriction-modification system methyltransferase subunit [Dactylococcopsis salina PCC 8305]
MSEPQLQPTIQELLRNLNNLSSLRELFAELNYDRANLPLSTRNWSETTASLLAADPLLLATAGEDFHIIYCRLNSDQLRQTEQRLIINQLLTEQPYALFIFSDSQQTAWHFVNVKYDPKQEKREVFRRLRVSQGEQLRTAVERLSLLDVEDIGSESPLAIQTRHDEAFDVEQVTQKFFKAYREVFEQVETLIEPTLTDQEQRRIFTQKLFNRLMFIAFIQKKGWLTFQGNTDYLNTLWKHYNNPKKSPTEAPSIGGLGAKPTEAPSIGGLGAKPTEAPSIGGLGAKPTEAPSIGGLGAKPTEAPSIGGLGAKPTEAPSIGGLGAKSNFYQDHLKPLFFYGLNNPQQNDITGINNGGYWGDIIGTVPYLNGGLFEQDETDKNEKIIVPDEAIEKILEDLFSRFNFTVTESTPLDVEVAVDPEMLGKVFEELVTGRHESGSYYTPKPIVSFMCREALKGYLNSQLENESETVIAEFVDERHPENLRDPEAVLAALKRVKVCDPACGSGAYLLGMLQELLELRNCLFNVRKVDPKTTYQRKLEIIENNVYGVDIDQFAVNIARLRLWLSLAVEYEGDDPPPLPNLKFKIETGDSLLAPNPQGSAAFRDELIKQYQKAKAKYLRAHKGGEKQELEAEINQCREQISLLTHGHGVETFHTSTNSVTGTSPSGFDWAVEFAEVIAEGGFDIQVANPPYVRQELIKEIKPNLRKVFPEVYTGTSDLYCFFYARSLQLLRKGGMLAFISSNKWFRANYGEKLREHIAETCQVSSITDFGDLPVFENAAVLVMIFIAQKEETKEQSTTFTKVQCLESPYPDVSEIIKQSGELLPSSAINRSNWLLTDAKTAKQIKKMQEVGTPLGDYIQGKIYRGILTGCNKAFFIDGEKREELISKDSKSAEIIKPLAIGDDIRKWHIRDKNRWLIVSKVGIKIEDYSAIYEHLYQWKHNLEKRSDKGKYWWELRACSYYDLFEKPKIIYPDMAKSSRFAFDTKGHFTNNTTFIIPECDLYLLSVLNTSIVYKFFAVISQEIMGNSLRFFRQYVEQIPIPPATEEQKSAISKLAQKCIDAKGVNCEKWEQEIDEIVAGLYGL